MLLKLADAIDELAKARVRYRYETLASIDDGARDPMTGRCGWTDGDGGLKCLDAQLKPPDRPMGGGL